MGEVVSFMRRKVGQEEWAKTLSQALISHFMHLLLSGGGNEIIYNSPFQVDTMSLETVRSLMPSGTVWEEIQTFLEPYNVPSKKIGDILDAFGWGKDEIFQFSKHGSKISIAQLLQVLHHIDASRYPKW